MAEALGITKAELWRNTAVHGQPGPKGKKKRRKCGIWFSTLFVDKIMDIVGVIFQRKMSAMHQANLATSQSSSIRRVE